MKNNQSESLREEIYHRIKDDIITGVLPQGTLLTEGRIWAPAPHLSGRPSSSCTRPAW